MAQFGSPIEGLPYKAHAWERNFQAPDVKIQPAPESPFEAMMKSRELDIMEKNQDEKNELTRQLNEKKMEKMQLENDIKNLELALRKTGYAEPERLKEEAKQSTKAKYRPEPKGGKGGGSSSPASGDPWDVLRK